MRLVSFEVGGRLEAGFERDGGYVELASVGLPGSMREFLGLGPAGVAQLRHAAGRLDVKVHTASAIKLRAPVTDPRKVVCVGLNYKDHARESGVQIGRAHV